MNDHERRSELSFLRRRIESNAYGPGDLERFRQLLAEELKPAVDAEIARRMPAAIAEQRRRAAAVEAGRRAGIAAGRRLAERMERNKRRW